MTPRRPVSSPARARRARASIARAVTAALSLAPALCLTQSTSAQEGPITFGEKRQHDWFSLYNTRAFAELQYEFNRSSFSPSDGPSVTTTEHRFEETFTLESGGAIYHPNLVELDLSGTFGLYQEFIDSGSFSDNRNGTILEYDLNATFLRKENTPLTVYARRSQETISRQFGPTLESDFSTYGAALDYRNPVTPMRLEVFHSEQTQSGFDELGGEFSLVQDAIVYHGEYRPSQEQVWTLDYSLSQVDQSGTGIEPDSYMISDLAVTHSLNFGERHQHNLSSAFSHLSQGGDLATDRLRWSERLLLRHTPDFETNYLYEYNQLGFRDTEQTSHRGQAGFTHRLYKSLVTSGTGGVEWIDRGDGSSTFEQYANLRFDYTKQVPLGTLLAFVGLGWSRSDNTAQDETIVVVDELRTFNNGQPIVLAQQNLLPETVRITDASGTILYAPGIDYDVTDRGTGFEIDRTLGSSRIAPGQTVLIDYELAPLGANVTTTNTFSIGGRYNIERGPLRGLSPYARYTQQEQSIDGEGLTLIPNSYTDVLVGAEYKFWDDRMTIGAEQQWHDSDVYPYNATRFFARYAERVRNDTTVAAGLNYSIIQYPEIDNTVRLLSATASATHQVSRDLFVVGSVTFRDQQDEQNGPSRGLEEQIELQWRKRQTTISIMARNANLTSDEQDSDFQYLRIGIRRDF